MITRTIKNSFYRVRFAVLITLSLLTVAPAVADIVFSDVSGDAGLTHFGTSFGSSWGDVNGDHWPDLWAGNHGEPIAIYVNQRDGTFIDMADSLVTTATADRHGASWADFDNDGDQDLLVTVGGGSGGGFGANEFYVNHNGLLTNESVARGLAYSLGRGRGSQWLDSNNDGMLDVVIANLLRPDGASPSGLFINSNGSFAREMLAFSLAPSTNNSYAQLAPLDIDNKPLLLLHNAFPFPEGLYHYDRVPMENAELSLGFPNVSFGMDSMVSDFNGDGLMDVYLARQARLPTIYQETSDSFVAWLIASDAIGVEFRSIGTVSMTLAPPWTISVNDVHIGSSGYHPDSLTFTLDSTKTEDQGMPSFVPGVNDGIYIWFDVTTELWQFLSSNGVNANLIVSADQTLSDLAPVNFVSTNGEFTDRLYMNNGAGFTDMASAAGLGAATPCENGVAADFDNDMDTDIYLVCQNMAHNLPNLLYENQGDGTFLVVADAGGAVGSNSGRADTVTVADFDRDGRLDLFVNNGIGGSPLDVGPDQLFRNESAGGNRWLQIDVEGVVSNRDGIGAKVTVEAGGVNQLRLVGGNMHRFSQNDGRLHFGLGQNTNVDGVTVEWPSGAVQTIEDIAVNQLIRIVEPSTAFANGFPDVNPLTDPGVHVWPESSGYTMMLSAGSDPIDYEVTILSDQPLPPLAPQRYQSVKVIEKTDNSFTVGSLLQDSLGAIRFKTAAGSRTLIAVKANGQGALHLLKYGGKSGRLSPAGWVKTTAQLPALTDDYITANGGLFLGMGAKLGDLLLRWSGHGEERRGNIGLISALLLESATPVMLTAGDNLSVGNYELDLAGSVDSGWKGLNIDVGTAPRIGLTFLQDDTFSWHDVNPYTQDLGLPNAAWLPEISPTVKAVGKKKSHRRFFSPRRLLHEREAVSK